MQYSDGHNGRCAIGVLMSYFGWDGREDFDSFDELLTTLSMLDCNRIDENLILRLNDSGMSFEEIADYLDEL